MKYRKLKDFSMADVFTSGIRDSDVEEDCNEWRVAMGRFNSFLYFEQGLNFFSPINTFKHTFDLFINGAEKIPHAIDKLIEWGFIEEVKEVEEVKEFEPFELTFCFEREEDAIALWHRLNMSSFLYDIINYTERYRNTTFKTPHSFWQTIDKELRKRDIVPKSVKEATT